MRRPRWRWLRLTLLLPLLAIPPGLVPASAQPSEADEEANCSKVSQMVEANGAPAMKELERLAQRCVAYGQRNAARESAAAGLASLDGGTYFLVRWGQTASQLLLWPRLPARTATQAPASRAAEHNDG